MQSASFLVVAIVLVLPPIGRANTILYYDFNLGAVGTWATVTAPLTGETWHVGSDVGPLATADQVAGIMRSVTALEIGATGNAVSCGLRCNQPFGFYLSNPNLAGLVSDDFTNDATNPHGWSTDVGTVLWFSAGGYPSGGLINQISSNASPTQLLFIAPSQYLGNQSAAFGGAFSFAILAAQGTPTTPAYDLKSGRIILTGTSAAPEPATSALLGTTLGALGLLAWRRRNNTAGR